MKKKPLIAVLPLLTVFILNHAQAQSSENEGQTVLSAERSGHGNGQDYRDPLALNAALEDDRQNLESLKDAMDRLKNQIAKLSTLNVPSQPDSNDPFWSVLTSAGQKVQIDLDQRLSRQVTVAIGNINSAKKEIESVQETIIHLQANRTQYRERDAEKTLTEKLKSLGRSLDKKVKEMLASVVFNLYAFGSYEGIGNDGSRAINLLFGKAMGDCDSAPCLDLVKKKAFLYGEFVAKVGDIEVNVLSVKGTLGKLMLKYNDHAWFKMKVIKKNYAARLVSDYADNLIKKDTDSKLKKEEPQN